MRPFIDNSLSFYEISLSAINLLYPVVAPNIVISLTRFGYTYSTISCCSNTFSPTSSLTISPSVTTNTMKSSTAYSIQFSLSYFMYTHYILFDFCNNFGLVPTQQYPCYLALYTGTSTLNCTAVNGSQLRVQLTNSSANFTNILGF